ncbi:hypothetical protein [Kosakonia sp. S42]|uniref:hypothetical protein n=1 Tax=Kosakonia sp. S42 TaxID=2767458 RepID=UPI00190C695F|nr:hypothetical protein [Kosakonia sp. S42]MBK0019302.1 hypothetical protein [Kosakonia sp. S42]
MKKRFSDEQIISNLRKAGAGMSARELSASMLLRRHLLHLWTTFVLQVLIWFWVVAYNNRHQENLCQNRQSANDRLNN